MGKRAPRVGEGRPTTYTPELIEKAKTYLASYKNEGDVIPSIEGFAIFLSISRQTVYDWSSQDDKKEFFDIVEEILAKQARTLANMGLTGDFNASITKLMLTKHGYRDEKHQEHTIDPELAELIKKANQILPS